MLKALVVYTNGTEDIEVTAAVDVLHRGGVSVTSASVTNDKSLAVVLAHGTHVVCDTTIQDVNDEYDLIVVPGGPGTKTLGQCTKLVELLQKQKAANKYIGAICAAPGVVLFANKIIDTNTQATCYPQCECGGNFIPTGVVVDTKEKIVTGRSATYAIAFGLHLLQAIAGAAVARKVADDLLTDTF